MYKVYIMDGKIHLLSSTISTWPFLLTHAFVHQEGEVLNDNRRLAVSVTRAKHKLIVIGDSRALRRYAPLTRMIDACATVQIPASDVKQVIDKYGTSVAWELL